MRSETVAEETGISRQGESFARQEMLQEMRAEIGFGNMILVNEQHGKEVRTHGAGNEALWKCYSGNYCFAGTGKRFLLQH